MRFFVLSGLILGSLVILAFFLPWARVDAESIPENIGIQTSRMVNQLLGKEDGEESWLSQFLLMREKDWKDMWESPGEGKSGYQLFLLAGEGESSNNLTKAWMRMFFGEKNAVWRTRALALAPLLAALSMVLLCWRNPNLPVLGITILSLWAYYGLVRLKIAESYTNRLFLQIEFSYGLWISLYGLLLLSFLLTAKALTPSKRKRR